MNPVAKTFATCLVAALLLAIPAGAAQASDVVAARSCSVSGKPRAYGATYVLSLNVRNVSCRAGKRFIRNYHECRFRRGGRNGRCPHIGGFTCSESRFDRISTQYSSRVRCRKGGKRINHTYTQYT